MYTLASVCFMCFSKNNLKSVFHNVKDNIVAKQVKFVLSEIPNMTLKSTLHLYLCSTCCSSLASAYAFKKRCLEKYNRFNTYINILQAPAVSSDHPLIKSENQQNAKIKEEIMGEHFEESGVEDNADGEINSESQTSDVQDSAENNDQIQNNEQGTDIKNEVGEIKQELSDSEFVTSGDGGKEVASGLKYKCTICSKPFVCSSLLIEHLQEHAENTLNAAVKEEVMITDEEIEDNMSVHFEESEVDSESQDGTEQETGSQCISDGQNEVDGDINHQLLNSDDVQDGDEEEQEIAPDLKYKCTICSKGFKKRSNLVYHLKQHAEIKELQCYICKKQYKTKKAFKIHMNTHLKGKDYECPVCQKKFRENFSLRIHKKIHLAKQFKCTICNKAFVTKVELVFHLKAHAGIRKFKCKICGKGFITNYRLKIHSEVHSMECKICNETFDSRLAKLKHMKMHFQCSYCGKPYTSQPALAEHLKKHTGEKKYKCMMCEEEFHEQEYLNDHLKKHYGIKDYVCEFCNMAYLRKLSLKKHIRQKHPERL